MCVGMWVTCVGGWKVDVWLYICACVCVDR